MSAQTDTEQFTKILDRWISGISSVSVQYILILINGKWTLKNSIVKFSPVVLEKEHIEEISITRLRAGSIQKNISTTEISTLVAKILSGTLEINGKCHSLSTPKSLYFHTALGWPEPNHFIPRIEISSNDSHIIKDGLNIHEANEELRCSPTPFDGIGDLLTFFGFPHSDWLPNTNNIVLEVYSPVILLLDDCSLIKNTLKLKLAKSTHFRQELVSLGIRQFPNPGLNRRKQIGSMLNWSDVGNESIVEFSLDLDETSNVELLLSANGSTVTRYYIFDDKKSLNSRLHNYIQYDKEVKALRESLYSTSKESRYLESAIATLAYLFGFTTLNPPHLTDAPDLILETAQGNFALVECTTKISDIRSKAGKLVNRKFPILADENGIGIANEKLILLLVVNLPLEQIVDEADFLTRNEVLLVTKEDIDIALKTLQFPVNPNEIFKQAKEKLQSNLSSIKFY